MSIFQWLDHMKQRSRPPALSPDDFERLQRWQCKYMLAGHLDLSEPEAARWAFSRWMALTGRIGEFPHPPIS